jgi:hypothetical protein
LLQQIDETADAALNDILWPSYLPDYLLQMGFPIERTYVGKLNVVHHRSQPSMQWQLSKEQNIDPVVPSPGPGAIYHGPLTGRFAKDVEFLAPQLLSQLDAYLDGVRKVYVLSVPPDVATAREAIAWTFSMPADDYDHLVETRRRCCRWHCLPDFRGSYFPHCQGARSGASFNVASGVLHANQVLK